MCCAACALQGLRSEAAGKGNDEDAWLCRDSSGRQIKYARYLRVLERLLERAGYRWRGENGRAIFGTHSCRRGGAQSLARAGFSLRFIALWGRWGSSAIELYVEQAELEAVSAEVGGAIARGGAQEAPLRVAWLRAPRPGQ